MVTYVAAWNNGVNWVNGRRWVVGLSFPDWECWIVLGEESTDSSLWESLPDSIKLSPGFSSFPAGESYQREELGISRL